MTKLYLDSCKCISLEHLIVQTFLPVFLCLGSATPSMAQAYGRAASLSINPSLPTLENSYQIDTSMNCPSPRFSVGGFVGTGNDRASINDPYALSTSNINQYGVAAGISVPFGSHLSQFCEEFATGRLERQKIENENLLRNAQLVLISQCYWLKTNGFLEKNKDNFDKVPEFSSLGACSKISLERVNASIVNPDLKPPKADTPPPATPPVIIQDDRRRN